MTVLKTTFSKNKPREIVYRNYKYFNSQNFNEKVLPGKFLFQKKNGQVIESVQKTGKLLQQALQNGT